MGAKVTVADDGQEETAPGMVLGRYFRRFLGALASCFGGVFIAISCGGGSCIDRCRAIGEGFRKALYICCIGEPGDDEHSAAPAELEMQMQQPWPHPLPSTPMQNPYDSYPVNSTPLVTDMPEPDHLPNAAFNTFHREPTTIPEGHHESSAPSDDDN